MKKIPKLKNNSIVVKIKNYNKLKTDNIKMENKLSIINSIINNSKIETKQEAKNILYKLSKLI